MTQQNEIRKAMISSTARDLPEHRHEVLEACQRQGFFAARMEDLPAYNATAKAASLKMVDEADIYIGVFAHRYGYVPSEDNPGGISVTEMEYNRAVERKMPRLIFVMDPTHPITIDQVEQGEGAAKLKTFLGRVTTDNIVRFYKSPTDLRAEVINSLAQHLKEIAKAKAEDSSPSPKSVAAGFHYVSPIPAPPETYVAHPYSLLQTRDLIGRRDELSLLTDWVAKPDTEVYRAQILSITAIGGMGKSALTWKWFNDIAPEEMKPLAGRIWWSFYESDASFENFVIRALAYTTGRTIEELRQISSSDREAQLLSILDHKPYLIVLDGLERLLIAYARGDASRLQDNEVGSSKNLRRTGDPRVGQFLRQLARVKRSRILLNTRLFPAELETAGSDPLPRVFKRQLDGLSESDAVELWRAFGVSGGRDELRPIFDAIARHPLLIQALAGEVKRFKRGPGDFAVWRSANPHFNPAAYTRVQYAMAHVMEYALQDLAERPRRALDVIAFFRMPTGYQTLTAILVGDEKPCATEIELDAVLLELEDRGLVGWDRTPANRYDMHPIVRNVVWSALGEERRQGVYARISNYFETLPMIEEWREVNSPEDLTPAIELFHALIGMGKYDEATRLFYDRLDDATLYRFSASRQRIELLETLFSNGLNELPNVGEHENQAWILSALAASYHFIGQPGRAVSLLRRAALINSENNNQKELSVCLCNLADTLRVIGEVRNSEGAAVQALFIARTMRDRFWEAYSLQALGLTLAARGAAQISISALRRSLRFYEDREEPYGPGVLNALFAQREIWRGECVEAQEFADRTLEFAQLAKSERDDVRAARLRGEVALCLNDSEVADERLHHALFRARAVNLVEEELPALTALAELRRRQGEPKAALEFLDDIWEYAERGPYPLLHADALNVLAQIERDAGNTGAAIEAATKAYRLAWCDGPPYAYHWGLIKAQKHLEELGAPLPEMPPFDESKCEPMPEVEIDPDDEFHVGDKVMDELTSN